jgi:hypothetical protein
MPSDGVLYLVFNVLVKRLEDDIFLAHCVELDLVAVADSESHACDELLNLIGVQIRTCLNNDNLENLYFPAPLEIWRELGRVQQRCEQQTFHISIPVEGKYFCSVDCEQRCYIPN